MHMSRSHFCQVTSKYMMLCYVLSRPGKSSKPANLVRGKIVVLEGLVMVGKQNGEKEKGKRKSKEKERKKKNEIKGGAIGRGTKKRDFRCCISL